MCNLRAHAASIKIQDAKQQARSVSLSPRGAGVQYANSIPRIPFCDTDPRVARSNSFGRVRTPRIPFCAIGRSRLCSSLKTPPPSPNHLPLSHSSQKIIKSPNPTPSSSSRLTAPPSPIPQRLPKWLKSSRPTPSGQTQSAEGISQTSRG